MLEQAMHCLMDDVELVWSEIVGVREGVEAGKNSFLDELLDNSSTLEGLFLGDWLGSIECAILGVCDGTELGFLDGIALVTKLEVSEISSLRYADGSQHLSFGYPYPARKQLS